MGSLIFNPDPFIHACICFLQIFVSKKWGFTKFDRARYEELRDEGRLAPDGCNVKYRPEHGPMAAWEKVQAQMYAN